MKTLVKTAFSECKTIPQQKAFFAACNRRRKVRTGGRHGGRPRKAAADGMVKFPDGSMIRQRDENGHLTTEYLSASAKVVRDRCATEGMLPRTGGGESKPQATEGTATA